MKSMHDAAVKRAANESKDEKCMMLRNELLIA